MRAIFAYQGIAEGIMMEKKSEMVKIFLLGVIAAFLGVLVFQGKNSQIAFANGSGGEAGDLIAVTGPEDAGLFLIDTKNQRMAFYVGKRTEGLKFRGARYFNYDYQLYDSNKYMTVKDAKKQADKDKKKFRNAE